MDEIILSCCQDLGTVTPAAVIAYHCTKVESLLRNPATALVFQVHGIGMCVEDPIFCKL